MSSIAARNRAVWVGTVSATELLDFESRSRGCATTPMITVYRADPRISTELELCTANTLAYRVPAN